MNSLGEGKKKIKVCDPSFSWIQRLKH